MELSGLAGRTEIPEFTGGADGMGCAGDAEKGLKPVPNSESETLLKETKYAVITNIRALFLRNEKPARCVQFHFLTGVHGKELFRAA
jgi:hypothetical protein